MNQNATREQITTALKAGKTNTEISRELRADRARVRTIRNELGIPATVRIQQPLTLEEKWAANTRPIDGGHLEWAGERQTISGTPVLRYRETTHSAAQIAYRIKHGRDPQGYVYADCGHKRCVAPDHVDDEAGRRRTREQLRYLTGGQEHKDRCVHGHDLTVHVSYESDGRAYCAECKRHGKRTEQAAA